MDRIAKCYRSIAFPTLCRPAASGIKKKTPIEKGWGLFSLSA
jgi:hypothetical protein